MADISISKSHPVQQWLPGLLLCGTIAAVTALLAQVPAVSRLGLGSLTLAIMLGIIIGNTVYSPMAVNVMQGCCWQNKNCSGWASFCSDSASPYSKWRMSA